VNDLHLEPLAARGNGVDEESDEDAFAAFGVLRGTQDRALSG